LLPLLICSDTWDALLPVAPRALEACPRCCPVSNAATERYLAG
jgi:hypothetical protein